ncbi:MAG: GNAT family N-acetyltransferase [Candidatus Odinarchaeota archaeon]
MSNDFDVIEEISDRNLFLRKISKNDIDFFFKSLNEKNLTAYLSLGPLSSLEHSKALIKNYLRYWDKYVQFNYIIEIHNLDIIKIGSISLWNVNWQHRRTQIGVWILPKFWGKGLAERSLNLIKKISFNHLKMNRLEAYIALDNKRSVSLFERSGFKREGTLKQYLKFQGKYHDAIILALTKDNLLN